MEISSHLQGTIDTAPTKPGCYIMKDADGKVIYVGKAVNLRNRLRSYFHASAQDDRKTRRLVSTIVDIEWIVVGSELEALILEMNLIKKHRPHFNVRLVDDKSYPYIKVHWNDPFPKVTVTRQMVQDGSRYYGPYTSVWAVHQTLDVLRRIFPYLTCDRVITGKDERACLYHDIKLCTAPCIGAIDQAGYRQMIEDLGQFLEGRTEPILSRLRIEMDKAAEELHFERAAALRDQIQAIERVVEKQKVVSSDYIDSDVIAMARTDGEACLQIFFIRGGKLIGREYFLMKGAEESADADVIAGFIKQFYNQSPTVPAQVLLPQEIEEMNIIREWLRTRRGGEKVEIRIPRKGPQQELIQMAAENASATLAALQAQWHADTHQQEQALAELQTSLNLPSIPIRIECYDISNTQGTAAVGSMVVFEQGVPKKNLYRRFITFERLIPIPLLPDIKRATNRLEKRYATPDGNRRMNIDPGYVCLEHVILATTKGYTHRPYLREGIYADLSLIYRNRSFQPLEWTYPDYRHEDVLSLFNQFRKKYVEDMKKELVDPC